MQHPVLGKDSAVRCMIARLEAGRFRDGGEHWLQVFGGTVIAATYADLGMPADAPGANKIVHGQVANERGFRVMAYDTPGYDTTDTTRTAGNTRRDNGVTITDRTFFQSVRGETLDEVTAIWDALADGPDVMEPLAASPWSPGFGMLTDRFGVTWIIDVQPAQNA